MSFMLGTLAMSTFMRCGRFGGLLILWLAAASPVALGQEPGEAQEVDQDSCGTDLPEDSQEALRSAFAEEPEKAESRFPVHGSFSLQYRFRKSHDESDHDLHSVLALDVGEETQNPVRFHFLGRVTADLDGISEDDESSAFDGLVDVFDQSVVGLIYECSLDFDGPAPIEVIRLGRQSLIDTPVVAGLDGALVESEPFGKLEATLGAYGGLPTHLYESSYEGDLLAGAYAQARPWRSARLRVDWMHVDDEREGLGFDDDLFGIGFWQGIGGSMQVDVRATFLEEASRDLRLLATCQHAPTELRVQASYYELFHTQRQASIEIDPFYSSALDYFPYRQAGLSVARSFGECFDVAAGTDVRRLRESGDTGPFNREFERYYLAPTFHDFLVDGTDLTITGDLWDADDDATAAVGVELLRTFKESLDARIGSSYALFKQDFYDVSERFDVRTYYLSIDCRASKRLRLAGRYELELDDFDTYHNLRIGATWTF